MVKVEIKIDPKHYYSVKKVIEILIPKIEVVKSDSNAHIRIKTVVNSDKAIEVKSYLDRDHLFNEVIRSEKVLKGRHTEVDIQKRILAWLKLTSYRLLTRLLDVEISPWGILIGVRPTKIAHKLLDRGLTYKEIEGEFKDVYGVAKEKTELLLDVIRLERPYLLTEKEAQKKVSIYLGIPFCPSRCHYCSFASYPLNKEKSYLGAFLKALDYEIKKIGEELNRLDLNVDTIYIGGGTPTILSGEELSGVLESLNEYFVTSNLREFTVEAGRPDTINKLKLETLKEWGVGRISINPQSMNLSTLKEIGRNHSPEEVVKAFNLAREVGFDNINMDLILGLPREGLKEVKVTLDSIRKLNPDSLTVHTLAIKRASKFSRDIDRKKLLRVGQISHTLKEAQKFAKGLDMNPYYMYRQKSILGNMENVGYSKEKKESIYNILMMEERSTVIGLGGGAITKLLNPQDWSFKRLINPKLPHQYIEEIKDRTDNKIAKLTSLVR